MFTFSKHLMVESLEEAYTTLIKSKKNIILGGTSYLRMSNASWNIGIDLSKLGLDYIETVGDEVHIGGYTSFRSLETNEILKEYFGDVFRKALKNILGIQFRSNVTVGATVFSKYGFSDLIPVLLGLKSKIELYKGGIIELEEYLKEEKYRRDILVKVIIPLKKVGISFQSVRKSKSDYSILNVVVAKIDGEYRVVTGARPGRAVVVKEGEDLKFSSNMRGSKEYRELLFKALLKKAMEELENGIKH